MFHVSRPHAKGADRAMSGAKMDVGIADDQVQTEAAAGNRVISDMITLGLCQARDFDFIKTEMKYDSTGMFHWIPASSIEDCILVSRGAFTIFYYYYLLLFLRTGTRRP